MKRKAGSRKSRPMDPSVLLNKSRAYQLVGNWEKAIACLDEAIAASPDVAALHTSRAVIHRHVGKLDAAIADYSRTIELDAHNSGAWMMRAACKMEKAASELDHGKSMALMAEAHPDYRRAAELRPDSEMTGLALLELEICIGKYLEAVGTTGEWWDRIDNPELKLVCAWLGAIAMILAGRPERRWAHLRDHLQSDSWPLDGSWCLVEIDHHIKFLETQPGLDLTQVKAIHELFLSHFPDLQEMRRG